MEHYLRNQEPDFWDTYDFEAVVRFKLALTVEYVYVCKALSKISAFICVSQYACVNLDLVQDNKII